MLSDLHFNGININNEFNENLFYEFNILVYHISIHHSYVFPTIYNDLLCKFKLVFYVNN